MTGTGVFWLLLTEWTRPAAVTMKDTNSSGRMLCVLLLMVLCCDVVSHCDAASSSSSDKEQFVFHDSRQGKKT